MFDVIAGKINRYIATVVVHCKEGGEAGIVRWCCLEIERVGEECLVQIGNIGRTLCRKHQK